MSIFKIQNGNFFQPNSLTSIFALSNVRGGLVNTLKRCKPLCTRHWPDAMLKKQKTNNHGRKNLLRKACDSDTYPNGSANGKLELLGWHNSGKTVARKTMSRS